MLEIVTYQEKTNPDLVKLGFHTPISDWKFDYDKLIEELEKIKHKFPNKYRKVVREIAEQDFWFFMFYCLQMPIFHPYLVNVAYLLQEHSQDPYLYFAGARGSWKSTFMTIGLPLWETAKNSDTTNVILSYERQMAKKQLLGIKNQCERSPLLWECWPETFYSSAEFRSKLTDNWNINTGLFVKRGLKSSDPTFVAYGFIEGIPTGFHFNRLIIDDPVTLDNTATVESIEKVNMAFKMLNGIKDRERKTIVRVVTTRYDVNDLSKQILSDTRYFHIVRPSEVNKEGKACFDGIPVFRSREELDDERISFGDAYYAAQMLQDPTIGGDDSFDPAWIKFYTGIPDGCFYYIFVDPAGSKNKKSDFSVFVVIAVSADRQFFLIDMIRDKLDVFERFEKLKYLHQKYKPEGVWYEIQGMNSDLEVFEREMRTQKYYMALEKFSSNEQNAKRRRILALVAMIRKGEFLLPEELYYDNRNLIDEFIEEEYKKYPNNRFHDDMLDCMSFITQCPIAIPEKVEDKVKIEKGVSYLQFENKKKTTWATQFCSW